MTRCLHTLSDGDSQHILLLDFSQVLVSLLTGLLHKQETGHQTCEHLKHQEQNGLSSAAVYLVLTVGLQKQGSWGHGGNLKDVLTDQGNLLQQLLGG